MIKKITKQIATAATQHKIVRYIIAGTTSAIVNFLTYFLLLRMPLFSKHYLYAAIIAFCVSFVISYTLQKFWVFQNHSKKDLHLQIGTYLLTSLGGLAINMSILYLLVDKSITADIVSFLPHFILPNVIRNIPNFIKLVSNLISSVLAACCTFFISKNFVFKNKKDVIVIVP